MSIKYLRLPRVIELTGHSRSSLYTLLSQGAFPPPVRAALRLNIWIEAEILEWMRGNLSGAEAEPVQLDLPLKPNQKLLSSWEVLAMLPETARKQFAEWHSPGSKPPFPVYFAEDGRRRYVLGDIENYLQGQAA
jgi:prophage regulatory protein